MLQNVFFFLFLNISFFLLKYSSYALNKQSWSSSSDIWSRSLVFSHSCVTISPRNFQWNSSSNTLMWIVQWCTRIVTSLYYQCHSILLRNKHGPANELAKCTRRNLWAVLLSINLIIVILQSPHLRRSILLVFFKFVNFLFA